MIQLQSISSNFAASPHLLFSYLYHSGIILLLLIFKTLSCVFLDCLSKNLTSTNYHQLRKQLLLETITQKEWQLGHVQYVDCFRHRIFRVWRRGPACGNGRGRRQWHLLSQQHRRAQSGWGVVAVPFRPTPGAGHLRQCPHRAQWQRRGLYKSCLRQWWRKLPSRGHTHYGRPCQAGWSRRRAGRNIWRSGTGRRWKHNQQHQQRNYEPNLLPVVPVLPQEQVPVHVGVVQEKVLVVFAPRAQETGADAESSK